MIIVDRASFIAWSEGILLDRKADGSMIVGDKAEHEKALQALDSGETIGLTIDGKLVTHMAYDLESDSYRETLAHQE